jgi:hypothetical protein
MFFFEFRWFFTSGGSPRARASVINYFNVSSLSLALTLFQEYEHGDTFEGEAKATLWQVLRLYLDYKGKLDSESLNEFSELLDGYDYESTNETNEESEEAGGMFLLSALAS